jgi:hypothetical protein
MEMRPYLPGVLETSGQAMELRIVANHIKIDR